MPHTELVFVVRCSVFHRWTHYLVHLREKPECRHWFTRGHACCIVGRTGSLHVLHEKRWIAQSGHTVSKHDSVKMSFRDKLEKDKTVSTANILRLISDSY